MLWPGCTCALNGGTTTVEIARAIPGVPALHDGVTVVTNAVNIATELTVRPFIKIVVSGGVARPQTYELVGPIASETLGRLTPDLCFLGATGVDVTAGVTSDDEAEAAVNRVMVQQAKRTIVVADSRQARPGRVRPHLRGHRGGRGADRRGADAGDAGRAPQPRPRGAASRDAETPLTRARSAAYL